MGIRFNTNTWRAPLQLIDCWLPIEQHSAQIKPLALPKTLQKFVRAGWLARAKSHNREAFATDQEPRPCATVHSLDVHRRALIQTHPSPKPTSGNRDTRLVLSGRMSDVCAELERLAAMELRTAP
jgi:hypothetical protein